MIFSFSIEASFSHNPPNANKSKDVRDYSNDKLIQKVFINYRLARAKRETFENSSSVGKAGKFRIIAAFYLVYRKPKVNSDSFISIEEEWNIFEQRHRSYVDINSRHEQQNQINNRR